MARHEVESAVAGHVWQVEVVPDQRVAAGDVLVILESMKMEIPVESPAAGQVTDVLVSKGDPVEEGQVVAVVQEA